MKKIIVKLLSKILISKTLLLMLVDEYNNRVIHRNRLEVREPQTFLASVEVDINTEKINSGKHKEENQRLLKNTIAEKKFDMRRLLMKQISKEGLFKEVVTTNKDSILIEVELKVFDYEEKRDGKKD